MREKNGMNWIKAAAIGILTLILAFGVLRVSAFSSVPVNAKEDIDKSLVKQKLSLIKVKKKDSVYTKVKKVHDWMIYNFQYDHLWLDVDDGKTSGYTSAQIAEAKTHEPYTVNWVLKNNKAICQGYSVVFKAMMDELGIECKVISSEGMNHAWNMVKMDDGHWYHIDVTWDDGGYTGATDLGGYNTECFLRSDKGISKEHFGWNSDAPKANGKKYEKNVKHDYRYNMTEKDTYWSNGNIKINYDCNDYSLYTKYSKTGVITYKKFRYTDGSLGEKYFSKKGVITKERTEFTDGTVTVIKYNKKGINSSKKTVFYSGQIQEYSYDKNGVLVSQKTTYTDGAVSVATYTDGIISYEKTDFTDGSVSEDWYKNGIKTKHIYTFKSGAYWYETYDKNGNLKTKSYFFEDGTEKKYN